MITKTCYFLGIEVTTYIPKDSIEATCFSLAMLIGIFFWAGLFSLGYQYIISENLISQLFKLGLLFVSGFATIISAVAFRMSIWSLHEIITETPS